MDDIDLFYDENWDGLMFGDGASISAKVGQRLGVPFTRSMQEKVDIQLSFPSSSTCSPHFFMQAYASLSGANDLTTILDIGEIVFAYKKRHEVEERAFFSQLSQTCKLRVLDAHSLQKINVTEDMTKSGLYIVLAEKLVL
eukprot:gene32293-39053_t